MPNYPPEHVGSELTIPQPPVTASGGAVNITATSPIVVTPSPITGAGDISHADSGVTAGTYGDSTHVGQFTVNAKGHITAASNVSLGAANQAKHFTLLGRIGYLEEQLAVALGYINRLTRINITAAYAWVWGDGSDGSVNFDGTNTYPSFSSTTGAAPNLVYRLTRNLYATDVTLASGKTLNAWNNQLYCTGTFTCDGHMSADGAANLVNPQTGLTGVGQDQNGNYLPAASSGSGGGSGVNGSNGSNSGGVACLGGAAGAGGTSSTGKTGGAGGSANVTGFTNLGIHRAFSIFNMQQGMNITAGSTTFQLYCGGAGGGGGGGGGAGASGGAGGTGGAILGVFARRLAGSGTITAKGGDGNRGDWNAPGGGGGGGGGGGAILAASTTIYSTITGLSWDVSGGSGGGSSGGGSAGSNGSAGNFFFVQLVDFI